MKIHGKKDTFVSFYLPTTVTLTDAVFLDVTPCSLVEVKLYSSEMLANLTDCGVTSQKTVIFIKSNNLVS